MAININMNATRNEWYDDELAREKWDGSQLERSDSELGKLARMHAPIRTPADGKWRVTLQQNVTSGEWYSKAFADVNDAVDYQRNYVTRVLLPAKAAEKWAYNKGAVDSRVRQLYGALDNLQMLLEEINRDTLFRTAAEHDALDAGDTLELAWALIGDCSDSFRKHRAASGL